MKNILGNPEDPLHNKVIQKHRSSSDLLQHTPLEEILSTHSYNRLQWLFEETQIMKVTATYSFPSGINIVLLRWIDKTRNQVWVNMQEKKWQGEEEFVNEQKKSMRVNIKGGNA